MMNALVVEDEKPLRNWLKGYLSHKGYEVVSASSGREALDKCDTVPSFDLALVDNKLEGRMQGTEVVAELLKEDKARKIVIISAYPPNETIEQLKKRGVGFLEKPYTTEKFFSSLGMDKPEEKKVTEASLTGKQDQSASEALDNIDERISVAADIQQQKRVLSQIIEHAERGDERLTAVVPLDTYHQFETTIVASVSEIKGIAAAFGSRVDNAFQDISSLSNSQLALRDRITTLEALFKKSESDLEKTTSELRHKDAVDIGKRSVTWTVVAAVIAIISILLNIVLTLVLNWDKIFPQR